MANDGHLPNHMEQNCLRNKVENRQEERQNGQGVELEVLVLPSKSLVPTWLCIEFESFNSVPDFLLRLIKNKITL